MIVKILGAMDGFPLGKYDGIGLGFLEGLIDGEVVGKF